MIVHYYPWETMNTGNWLLPWLTSSRQIGLFSHDCHHKWWRVRTPHAPLWTLGRSSLSLLVGNEVDLGTVGTGMMINWCATASILEIPWNSSYNLIHKYIRSAIRTTCGTHGKTARRNRSKRVPFVHPGLDSQHRTNIDSHRNRKAKENRLVGGSYGWSKDGMDPQIWFWHPSGILWPFTVNRM